MTVPVQLVRTATNDVAGELTTETLIALAERQIGAIHVRGYYPVEIAAQVVDKAINHPQLGHYHKEHTSSVGRVYMPHIDTKWDPNLTAKYHDAALPAITEVRSMFHPYLAPIDRIRLELQELWPAGANLMRLRGRACFVGAFRVFQPDTSEFYPHNDAIDQETDAPEIEGVLNQLVANVYLQVPDEGGNLQLWLREPTPEETKTILEVEGLEASTVEEPVLEIHPEAGDLIIFSPRMLHAVTSGKGVHRVGAAAFIASKGRAEPLVFWS
ncbi:2OG-Fe(II) oxygenase [Amycolatopsis sp. PS_44_ISF1]|uniref:2OG-Fe(II)-dependent halogenase WelO5 family protein n=1 Tax=Amycolatopsis sp. PS_44_ISF1 TaxID=2974917 RepID=UPI0028DD5FDB|nr:2OG-Fe(II) oxygenase [Amycolatopsis sp. PS_44_ISF1]MDT8916011.1 2OG-Fe(II) oxygenase [Amycolatopsis sp. PS_44_ISF1]